MDLMGVATQVVYPTLFLAYITDDVKLEVALCRSYNRFMAGVWEQAQGRLRWVVVPPLRSIDASIEEMNFAKEHGAVGLFFRGIERDRTLDDPYFFPVYQEAARLHMPICVHTGAGCPAFTAIFDVSRSHTFPIPAPYPRWPFATSSPTKSPSSSRSCALASSRPAPPGCPMCCTRCAVSLEAVRSSGGQSFRSTASIRPTKSGKTCPTWCNTSGRTTWSWAPTGAITAAGRGGDPSGQPEVFGNMRSREDVPGAIIDKMLADNARQLYALAE